jgi:hypothetical protein
MAKFTVRSLRQASRQFVLALAASVLAAGAFGADAPASSPAPAAPAPRPPLSHFRVLWMHDPAEKAAISWTTPTEGKSHVIHYDTQPRQARLANYARKVEASQNSKYTMIKEDAGTPEGWGHHGLLENLTPATTYYFVVASDGAVSREFHFITAPDDNRPVKLLFGGDSRRPPALPEPHLPRREVNRLVAGLVDEHPEIMALAHGGDYCSRAEWRFMSDWLSDHELIITPKGRILPIIPARGNHDAQVGFEEIFFWPARTHPYYFSTALSKRVALVTLNTQLSRAGDQRDWLETELVRQREQPDKWVVVQYHIPAYGSVKSFEGGQQQRQHWVPLFEQHQVNLVCEADHHMLKRTVPIYQDKHDVERGIVYIGDGGMGVPQRVPDTTRWYLKSPGLATPAHHLHLLEFEEDELRVTAIGLEKQVLDKFSVHSKAVPAGR